MPDDMQARLDYAKSVYAEVAGVQAAVSRKAILCMSIAGASLGLFVGNLDSWKAAGLLAAMSGCVFAEVGGLAALCSLVAAAFMALFAALLRDRPLPWAGSAEATYDALNDPRDSRTYDQIVGWYLMAAEGLAGLVERRGGWTNRALWALLFGLGLGAVVTFLTVVVLM